MRPALWMAAALVVGITAADWLRPHPALAMAAVCVVLVWAGATRRWVGLALLVAVAAAGMLRYAWVQTGGRGDIGAWEGRRVEVLATVSTEPELLPSGGSTYAVNVERVSEHPASGKLYVTQYGGGTPVFGERVAVTGTPKSPNGPRYPGGFDQAGYLARQSIYFTIATGDARRLGPGSINPLWRAAVAVRLRLEATLKRLLPPDQAALMSGLLLGSRADLPADVKDAFKASGVLHLLAVSGGNLAMIIMPLLALLGRVGVPKRWATAMALAGVVFFVFLTGATPSVLRAGCMAGLVLAGDLLGRERDALNTLGAAAFLLLLWSPGLLFDLGFQLSAGATLGIFLLAGRIQRWMEPRLQALFGVKAGEWLAAGLSVTLAAQAMVEPISLHSFGATSTVAPVANLLVLAFVEPLVQVGSVMTVTGLLFLPGARLLALPVHWGLWLLVAVVKTTAAVPGAYWQVGNLPAVGMVAWYAALVVLATPRVRESAIRLAGQCAQWWVGCQRTLRWELAGLAVGVLAVGLIGCTALSDPPDTLRITFLDVGQGDAVLIEAPGDHAALIDAGPAVSASPRIFDAGADVVAPYLKARGIKQLDYLILTHADGDHAGGAAAVLQAVSAKRLLVSGEAIDQKGFVDALAAAHALNLSVERPHAGAEFHLGSAVLAVLNPPAVLYSGTASDANGNCLVLRLTYRQMTTLFACDMEAVAEERLLAERSPLRADLLKVSHHGSGSSSTASFLQAVRPRWAVLSVGAGNTYGHPHASTLHRLTDVGAAILRTDRQGNITVRTDGRTITVGTSRRSAAGEGYNPVSVLGRRLLFAW